MTAARQQAVQVAIVGGGITGLSAAWFLQQAAARMERPLTYALLESSRSWGGKIVTESGPDGGAGPLVVEGGPDSFITQKPWGLQLAGELGLNDQLLPTQDERRQTFVVHRGRLVPLPDGLMLTIPTRLGPFLRSPLISLPGKLRMGLDLVLPARKDDQDETLADFMRRRFGREALDKIAEPLMSGIYNAEAERQSILATFPMFRDLEKKHGSLIKGILAGRRARAAAGAANGTLRPPQSMFMSFQKGMATLVEALVPRLRGDLRLEAGVERLRRRPAGGYELQLAGGSHLAAEAIILAVPAYAAAHLLEESAPQAAAGLKQIRYVGTGTISLVYDREKIGHPLDGFGFVIPRSERRLINAVTWSSTKFDRPAHRRQALLRVFFGGSRRPEMMELADGALFEIVVRELESLMGITAAPTFHRIFRWPGANPQYDAGHLGRVAAIESALPAGLFVSGSPYRGIGVPDCIRQARETVAAVMAETIASASGQPAAAAAPGGPTVPLDRSPAAARQSPTRPGGRS